MFLLVATSAVNLKFKHLEFWLLVTTILNFLHNNFFNLLTIYMYYDY
jgi:hypothetical protein